MSDCKHKLGLYLGRFQPLHIGHTSIIDKMLDECEHIVIAIGSAQESGTEHNPLEYSFRASLIKDTYFNKLDMITIVPINDRETYSDDSSWGVYLLEQVYNQCKLRPTIIYGGDELVNTNWYNDLDIAVVRVSRYITRINGTELRKAIKSNRDNFALTYIPKMIHRHYYEIRKEIQNGTAH